MAKEKHRKKEKRRDGKHKRKKRRRSSSRSSGGSGGGRHRAPSPRRLLLAAALGDKQQCRELVQDGADVAYADAEGTTALHEVGVLCAGGRGWSVALGLAHSACPVQSLRMPADACHPPPSLTTGVPPRPPVHCQAAAAPRRRRRAGRRAGGHARPPGGQARPLGRAGGAAASRWGGGCADLMRRGRHLELCVPAVKAHAVALLLPLLLLIQASLLTALCNQPLQTTRRR